jgi:hypothetical protein
VRTLNGIPNIPQTQVFLQVAVYDNVRWASYAAAVAGGGILGTSAVFPYTVPTPPLGPTDLDMANFQAFVFSIPEPSVIGLGLIGAAALFMLRLRKCVLIRVARTDGLSCVSLEPTMIADIPRTE